MGLRTAEACGLRVSYVDSVRGVVSPAIQWRGEPLKSQTSRTVVPIPAELALGLPAAVTRFGGDTVVTNGVGGSASPWAIERAMRSARKRVVGLPADYRFHDSRH